MSRHAPGESRKSGGVTFVFKAYESSPRSDEEILGALAMLAVAGAGYLVAEPFSKRQHAVNIRYRDGERIEWLTLGITWFDHVWLMTDFSNVTGPTRRLSTASTTAAYSGSCGSP